jgi:hypothetical protein
VAVGLLLKDIIALKFPVKVVRSLLKTKENIAKHNRNIIKKTLPVCNGKDANEPSIPFEINE